MAKSQRHGNKEAKKPKQIKVMPIAESADLLSRPATDPARSADRQKFFPATP